MMIAAIIEVCLKADRKRHCLKIAADLKPLLEKVTMSALPPKADINRCLRHLGFALGDGRISLQVGTPSGSYVRVMKDRLATIYAKVLFFSTRPFKNEF